MTTNDTTNTTTKTNDRVRCTRCGGRGHFQMTGRFCVTCSGTGYRTAAEVAAAAEKLAAKKAIEKKVATTIDSPIAAAVMPLKEAAIARAATEAQNVITRCEKELDAANGAIDIVAPRPRGTETRETYRRMNSRVALFSMLTRSTQASRRPSEASIVVIDAALCAKFIDEAKKDAAAQYDAFVAKLIGKIGDDVKSASLNGSHVWGYSFLTVTKTDGTIECWKTQMILNVSVLGTLFNQFPTRKVKC